MASSEQQGPSPNCDSSPERSVSSKSLEDLFLQCPVCLETYDSNTRSPRQLPCHHTFCLQCLALLIERVQDGDLEQNSLQCPTCRKKHTLGQTGIHEIPADYKMVRLMDFLAGEEKKKPNSCDKHHQQLNFFCKTCEVSVCMLCTVVSHSQVKGHEVMEITEALKEFTPQFIETRDRAENISQILQARSSMFEEAIVRLAKNESSEEIEIRKAFSDYREKLNEREQVLLSQLSANTFNENEKFEVLRELVTHEVFTFTRLNEQFEEASKQQDVTMLFDVMHQMKKWETSSLDLTCDRDELQYCMYNPRGEADFCEDVRNLGNIDHMPGSHGLQFFTEPDDGSVDGKNAGCENTEYKLSNSEGNVGSENTECCGDPGLAAETQDMQAVDTQGNSAATQN